MSTPLIFDARSLPANDPLSVTPDFDLREEPIHSRRNLRVVCLGAGYSGILMGIIWTQRMLNRQAELVIYERNADLGGTWLENRYPGCQCDIPAHNYAYSFEPNLEWPNYYATSTHIFDYLKKTAGKYDVEKHIKYQHEVEHAEWDEKAGKWCLTVNKNGQSFQTRCDVFIHAGGVLNKWKWPEIEGFDRFRGKHMHSAAWDETYDFTGKKVAVIGNGSSAIQIIPRLAQVASNLTSFIRSQSWISPAPGINEPTDNDPETDENYNYAPEVLQRFKKHPEECLAHCRALIDRRLSNFHRTHTASAMQKAAQELFKKTMKQRLGDSEKGRALADLLIPDFPVGCRRQTPGPGYLEALLQSNVETRWDDIANFTERGIQTKSGSELDFDVIVCATGFDTSFQPHFPIIGSGGLNLADHWRRETPKSYFGISVPNFPNYFTFIGPASPIANGSLVQGIQIQGVYIWKCIDKIQTERIKSLTVSQKATDDFFAYTQKFMERTVWAGGCRSWYKRGTIDGPVIAIYGGTSFHFIEALRNPRWEDYDISTLCPNRFSYLGNGYTLREEKNGSVADTQVLGFDDYWKLFVLRELYD